MLKFSFNLPSNLPTEYIDFPPSWAASTAEVPPPPEPDENSVFVDVDGELVEVRGGKRG